MHSLLYGYNSTLVVFGYQPSPKVFNLLFINYNIQGLPQLPFPVCTFTMHDMDDYYTVAYPNQPMPHREPLGAPEPIMGLPIQLYIYFQNIMWAALHIYIGASQLPLCALSLPMTWMITVILISLCTHREPSLNYVCFMYCTLRTL